MNERKGNDWALRPTCISIFIYIIYLGLDKFFMKFYLPFEMSASWIKYFTTKLFPLADALWRGVFSLASLGSLSHPECMKNLTISMCPYSALKCNGVDPLISLGSLLVENDQISWTRSNLPLMVAKCRGVCRSRVLGSFRLESSIKSC